MAYTDNFNSALISLVDDIVTADKVDMNEMLYVKNYENSQLADQHTIMTGVRNGHVIPIMNNTPNPDSFPFVDQTSCETTSCDVTNEYSAKQWELGLIECRVDICMRNFNENFLQFWNVFRQTQQGEPDLDTALLQFISGKFTDNLSLSNWRAAYFADKSSTSAYYNGVDGIFTQAEANADRVIEITQNAGVTYAEQMLTGEEVYNYLIDMYDRAAEEAWFDPSIMEYRLSRSMSSKLVTYLNRLGKNAPENCACLDPDRMVARNVFMLDGLTINGIPVMTHSEWDAIINGSTELNGGGGAAARVNPNRAILSVRSNVLIGTSQTEALNSFDIWYDKTDKKVYLEGSSYIGSALPLDEYVLAI